MRDLENGGKQGISLKLKWGGYSFLQRDVATMTAGQQEHQILVGSLEGVCIVSGMVVI